MKLPAQVIEFEGDSPVMTVVRCRFGSKAPLPAAAAVMTEPGIPISQHPLALPLVRATLVTCARALLVVRITYTWLSTDTQRSMFSAWLADDSHDTNAQLKSVTKNRRPR